VVKLKVNNTDAIVQPLQRYIKNPQNMGMTIQKRATYQINFSHFTFKIQRMIQGNLNWKIGQKSGASPPQSGLTPRMLWVFFH